MLPAVLPAALANPLEPATPVTAPVPSAARSSGTRALAVALLAWLAVLGAVLGNAAAFLTPAMAGHLTANALQLQRQAGTSAPRASRRDSPGAITQQQRTGEAGWGRSDADPDPGGLVLALLAAPGWAQLLQTSAVQPTPAFEAEVPRPAPRRRAHLGRAPPASA